jgi:hypothetical protein
MNAPNSTAEDWRRHYSGLEPQVRDLLRMAEIARFYVHEVDWPSATEEQHREIERVLFMVGKLENMAKDLEQASDQAFQTARGKSAA